MADQTTPVLKILRGNVGVGTTSPAVQLHVKSSSSTFAQLRVEAAADGYDSSVAYSQAGSIKGISGYDDSTDTVAIKYGTFGGSGIDIDSSGNVGIGTTSPSVALDVAGSFKTSSTATLGDDLLIGPTTTPDIVLQSSGSGVNTNGKLYWKDSGGTVRASAGYETGSTEFFIDNTFSGGIYLKSNGTVGLTVNSAANVGIGTTSPGYKLDVTSSSNTTFRTATTGTDRAEVAILKNSGTAQQWTLSVAGTTNGYSVADKYFYIADTTGGTTPLVIDKSGNVGIGTTTPDVKLEVSGGTANSEYAHFANNNQRHLKLSSYEVNSNVNAGHDINASSSVGALSLSTGGTKAIYIDSSQRVGIGTTSPTRALTVGNTSSATGNAINLTSSTSGYVQIAFGDSDDDNKSQILYDNNTDNLTFQTGGGSTFNNGKDRLVIDNTGNVGIGTTTPSRELEIQGSGNVFARITASTDSDSAALELNNNGNELWTLKADDTAADYFKITNSAGTALTIDTSRNVGIGTTSPDRALHLYSSSVATVLKLDSAGADTGMEFAHSDSVASAINSSSDGSLEFRAGGNSTSNEKMRITSDGSVGIGTTNPNSLLDVSAVAPIVTLNSTKNGSWTADEVLGTINFRTSDSSGGGAGTIASIKALAQDTTTLPNGSLVFSTGATSSFAERMRIDNDGKVGIGTTSPQYKLDVAGTINSSSAIYAADVVVNGVTPTITLNDTDGNANAATAWVAFQQGGTGIGKVGDIASGRSAMMLYAESGKELMFFTNGQNATSDTPAITINTSQNVGIGTTSPDYELEVSTSSNSRIAATSVTNSVVNHLQADSSGGYVGPLSNHSLFIKTNNTTRVTVDTSGNVGIGTTSPSVKLEVKDSQDSTLDSGIGIIRSASSQTGYINMVGGAFNFNAPSAIPIKFRDGGTVNMTILGDGNVGIGTESPTTTLHLSHPAIGQSGSAVTSITKAQALDLGLKLSFSGGANSDGNILGGIALGHAGEEYAGLYAIDGGSSAATDLAFFVGDTNGINEAVHIDSGGTVQINSPSAAGTRSLTVKLTDNTSGAAVFEQSSNEYLRINTTNGSEKIILGDNGTNPKINFNGEYDFPTADGTSGQVLTTDGSGTLSFSSAGSGTVSGSGTDNYIPRFNGTSALENSNIYDNGTNIGIGYTSPTEKLFVKHGSVNTTIARFTGANNDRGLIIGTAVSGSTNDSVITFDAVSQNSVGQHAFKTDGTERVRIDESGNVGIGTTSPAQKLDVVGNVKHEGLTMTSGTDIDQLATSSQSLTITTDWQDTGVAGSSLATGTYIVQLYANDYSVGGGQYSVYYSGTMSWYGSGTNDTDFNSEIVLHRAGHADNDKYLYLRTVTHASGTLSLEIAGNYTATGASTYTFKFRRMI